jgi:hypothetical protein
MNLIKTKNNIQKTIEMDLRKISNGRFQIRIHCRGLTTSIEENDTDWVSPSSLYEFFTKKNVMEFINIHNSIISNPPIIHSTPVPIYAKLCQIYIYPTLMLIYHLELVKIKT